MRVQQISTVTSKIASKTAKNASKVDKNFLARQKADMIAKEAEKRTISMEWQKRLENMLPEMNILGLPKWM